MLEREGGREGGIAGGAASEGRGNPRTPLSLGVISSWQFGLCSDLCNVAGSHVSVHIINRVAWTQKLRFTSAGKKVKYVVYSVLYSYADDL